ncbi:galactocerebrosidase [Candidatus Symbiothrix dinenymphae]|nr:galactocerebrosidase [Candidatus Symbiothrix dinenymphae]
MNKKKSVIFCCLLNGFCCFSQQLVSIDLSKTGRTYEGLGALSAGASSRLLIDYEEPYRSDILDYLFKPKFGANIQHLKVEIGGDVFSTDGTEPSHARTREEYLNPQPHYFDRGYEWWLMKEAKKRNPAIKLDILEWGAPGWIGDGKFYSDDNIDYHISFIKGAKKYHNLDIDYVGIWNERIYDTEYIKRFRKKLDQESLSQVKLVAADSDGKKSWNNGKYVWKIEEDILLDKDLMASVNVVGDHYVERYVTPPYTSPEKLQQTGIPLWNNEGGPWRGDWQGFGELAKLYNRDYIEGKMTKTLTWSLITCYYDNLALPNSGLMRAKTPWSGHYEVEPGLWAIAHTTQFVEPGWNYIDDGCGYLEKGSYVTLSADSKNKNFSIIIETVDAAESQKVSFRLQNTDIKNLKVWKTSVEGDVFKQEKDIKVNNSTFTLLLSPKSVYTISTEKGQTKGKAVIPPSKPFPFPYSADFEGEKINGTPRYFSDQGGAFEVVEREDKKGKCLRQIITRPCIEWQAGTPLNQTVIGDTAWADYSIKTDVYFVEPYSEAFVIGRTLQMHSSQKPADAYYFRVKSSGHWTLNAGSKILTSGWLPVTLQTWNTLTLSMKNTKITASINGTVLSEVEDNTFTHGVSGIGTSFNKVDFDNFHIYK